MEREERQEKKLEGLEGLVKKQHEEAGRAVGAVEVRLPCPNLLCLT